MILASEDIGNADPQALSVAVAAAQAVERVGMPESQIILSQAVTYMACAPKSNSAVNAIFAAMDSVKRTRTTVPVHLQDAHYGGHEKLGKGIGYKYAHNYPNHYVDQQYLPDEIQGERFFPGWYYAPEEEYIQKILKQIQKNGYTPELTQYSFCTNGSHYAGEKGIRTIGLGPSREDLAHTVDEYVELSQLFGAVECYYGVMEALLL